MHVKLGCSSAAAVACLLGLAVPAAASAPTALHGADARADGDLRVWIAEQPAAVRTDRPAELRYRLAFEAGARTERFALDIRPPQFPREGSAFLPLAPDAVAASGGVQLGTAGSAVGEAVCSTGGDLLHGEAPNGTVFDVVVPAHTTGFLDVVARLGRDAPWPGMAVRPTFEITRRLAAADDDGPATVPHDLRIVPARPRLVGPTGVRIRIRTNPRTPRPPRRRLPTFPAGRTIVVHGTTQPPLAHARVALRAANRTDHRRLRVAVRTDGRGRFRYRWHPQARGAYEVFASYRTHSRRVTSDHSCPRAFRIG